MKDKKELYIIIGPLGANKTRYSEAIAEFFNMEPIFWGKVGVGKNDKLTIAQKALSDAFKKSSRVIIDGFPTNKDEAVFLLEMSKKLDFSIQSVIQLNISLEKIIKNLKKRFICNNCGIFYEKDKQSRTDDDKCPNCGSPLIKYRTNQNKIQKDYYDFFNSVKEISEILSLCSKSYFSVSVEQPKHFVISSIFNKIKNQEKDFHTLYEQKSKTNVETKYGTFKIITYLSKVDYKHHLALVKGNVRNKRRVLLRIHSSCVTGDIFGSLRCDCGEQLEKALKIINKAGQGVLIYLYQEGRGINIINKIDAYNLQRKGADTVMANELLKLPPDMREYTAAKDILSDLGVRSVKILTNNPDKIYKLEELGIIVDSSMPLEIRPCKYNKKYIATKKNKMGHTLKLVK
jgi:GTP cyclohydrolase II